MSDRLIDYTGGYGNVYKTITKDPNLSIEAKGIYAYLSSYAGGKDVAFPSISLICHELNISEKDFINIEKSSLIKILFQFIENVQIMVLANQYIQLIIISYTVKTYVQNVHVQNVGTKKTILRKQY